MSKDFSIFILILGLFSSIQIYAAYNSKIIFKAVKEGNLGYLRRLLAKKGENFNIKDSGGATLLHYACARGHLNIVKYLVEEKRVSIKQGDEYGRKPIHHACARGHLHIVKYLVKEKGVSIKQEDYAAAKPIDYAVCYGKLDIVKYIFEKNGDLDCVDKSNRRPLDYALEKKRYSIVDYLCIGMLFDCSQKKTGLVSLALDKIKNKESLEHMIHIALRRKRYIEKNEKKGFWKKFFSFNLFKKNKIKNNKPYNFCTYCDVIITLFEKAKKNKIIKNAILKTFKKEGGFQKKYFNWVMQDLKNSKISLYSVAKIGTILHSYRFNHILYSQIKRKKLVDVKIVCKKISSFL